MTKKTSRIIGAILLIAAAVFIIYAVSHPEGSFPWSNTITYILYLLYTLVAVIALIAPFPKKQ